MHEGRSQEPSLLQGLVPEWVTQQGSADSNCELVWVQTCFPLPGWFTEHFGSPMAGAWDTDKSGPSRQEEASATEKRMTVRLERKDMIPKTRPLSSLEQDARVFCRSTCMYHVSNQKRALELLVKSH